jgi:hypothetical protein
VEERVEGEQVMREEENVEGKEMLEDVEEDREDVEAAKV